MDRTTLDKLVGTMSFAKSYGTRIIDAGSELRCITEWRDSFTGNPLLKAWHGGIVSGAMELTGLLAALYNQNSTNIDLLSINVSYLKPNRGDSALYTSAKVIRRGRQIVTIETQSWQDSRDNVTAHALLTFTPGG